MPHNQNAPLVTKRAGAESPQDPAPHSQPTGTLLKPPIRLARTAHGPENEQIGVPYPTTKETALEPKLCKGLKRIFSTMS